MMVRCTSASASPMPALHASMNFTSATLNIASASVSAFAPPAMVHPLALFQIFFNDRSFFIQRADMLLAVVEEFTDDFHRVDEGLGKFPLLLFPPGLLQRAQTRLEAAQQRADLGIESIQFLRKSPKIGRVHIGF